ncbi:MAG: pyridoxal 5'-phosphate synthase glutaminase subunit PdxT [Candidatus Hydrothermarchaeales archaeon]
MLIGVLGLQGDVIEHVAMLRRIVGKDGVKIVKYASEIEGLNGLIIPGGESTTICDLMVKYGVDEAIKGHKNLTIFGTCAGTIVLAKEIVGQDEQSSLKLMDIKVKRNAYGRQRESFEVDLEIPALEGEPFRAVFIRAPTIVGHKRDVEVLAELDGNPVIARQRKILVSSFHPELTDDPRMHSYFVNMVDERG